MKKVQIGKKHTPLVIGNWKENPPTLQKTQKLTGELKKLLGKKEGNVHVCVAPPSVFISEVQKTLSKTHVRIGAQDCSHTEMGAHTGEVSVAMLKSLGVTYIIAGHSERRALGERDEDIAQKVSLILKAGLVAVVCIGEKKRDAQGDYFNVVEAQLRSVLKSVPASTFGRLVIAYEPVWAIGTGRHASAEDVQEMKLFIQKIIADVVNRSVVNKVRILYGGSVTKDNAQDLLETGTADGFLVGGASLKAQEFASIVNTAHVYGQN